MIYLASAYSHSDSLIMRTRFLIAEQAVAHMTRVGLFVYSPIVHYHELAQKYNLQTDFEFWRACNFDMLRRADAFVILKINGWEESKGVKAEAEVARTLGIHRGFINEFGENIV